jgi:hypothetical protein
MTAARNPRGAYVTITTHVPRDVADAIHAAAHQRGISVSAATAHLLAEALRLPLEHSHAALLEAVVRQAVSHELRRVGDLAFRGALHSDELRRQMRPVLAHVLGQETAREVRREAHSAAWQQLREPLAAPPDPAAASPEPDGPWTRS